MPNQKQEVAKCREFLKIKHRMTENVGEIDIVNLTNQERERKNSKS